MSDSNVSFKASVSLLIYACMISLLIYKCCVKNPPLLTCYLQSLPLFLNICFMYVGALMFSVYIYIYNYIFLIPWSICNVVCCLLLQCLMS